MEADKRTHGESKLNMTHVWGNGAHERRWLLLTRSHEFGHCRKLHPCTVGFMKRTSDKTEIVDCGRRPDE